MPGEGGIAVARVLDEPRATRTMPLSSGNASILPFSVPADPNVENTQTIISVEYRICEP
jgi:hypothetical protein